MKVLTSPDGATILVLTAFTKGVSLDSTKFIGLDAKNYDKGVVAERPDELVKRAAVAATKLDAFEWMESKDFMRDLRFIAKACADVENGAEVGMIVKGSGIRLDIPQDARPNRAEGLAEGVTVAVGPNISPKALMNARGVVEAVNGARVTVRMDEGDIDRVNRATGKQYGKTMKLPKASVEVIA